MPSVFKGNRDLIRAVGTAVSDFANRYTFGLLLYGEDSSELEEVGSGVGVEAGGKRFIATAAHNLNRRRLEQIAVVHSPTQVSAWTPFVRCGRRQDDRAGVDLAWLEVDAECRFPDKHFLPFEQLGSPLSSSNRYFVFGFPVSRAQELPTAPISTIALTAFGLFTTLHEGMESTGAHAFFTYGAKGFRVVDHVPMFIEDAPGLSGCGIWEVALQPNKLWHPDQCRLVAIQHSWKRHDYVRGNVIEEWLQILRDDLPDLFI